MSNDHEVAFRTIAEWHLGQTSERYESSGLGVETISTGRDDHGGVSYGAYQLSSKAGTLREYLTQSAYGPRFNGLSPATPDFDAKWREIARLDPGFGQDQHDFIGRSHYQEQLVRLNKMGLPLGDRGRAVQDALWSTSVQFRDLTTTIFSAGLREQFGPGVSVARLSDRQIVEAVQDYKINHNNALFKSSSGLWPGLVRRSHSEKAALLKLLDCEALVSSRPDKEFEVRQVLRDGPHIEGNHSAPHHLPSSKASFHDVLGEGSSGPSVEHLQQQLHGLNYRSPSGRPLAIDGHFGPDTRHAVEAFQREHGLRVDGVVGGDTHAVLAAIQANPFTSKYHPHHALYEQALRQLHAEESRRHVRHGAHSEALAGALAVAAANDGLTRIDRVELNGTGTLARAVQASPVRDEPGLNRTTDPISTRQAMHVSAAHASAPLQPLVGHQRHPDSQHPVQASPSMVV